MKDKKRILKDELDQFFGRQTTENINLKNNQ